MLSLWWLVAIAALHCAATRSHSLTLIYNLSHLVATLQPPVLARSWAQSYFEASRYLSGE